MQDHVSPVVLKAARRLGKIWGLDDERVSALFGIPPEPPPELDADTLHRIRTLVSLYKALHEAFSESVATAWPNRPNTGPLFHGKTPIEVMIEGGTPAIERALSYVKWISAR